MARLHAVATAQAATLLRVPGVRGDSPVPGHSGWITVQGMTFGPRGSWATFSTATPPAETITFECVGLKMGPEGQGRAAVACSRS